MTDHRDQPVTLRCPNCCYDISQTLRDGITTCPECGRPIDQKTSIFSHRRTPSIGRAILLGVWLLGPWALAAPGLAAPFGDDAYFRLAGCCFGSPVALGLTVLWWIHFEHRYARHRDLTPAFLAVAAACVAAPFALLLLGLWL